MQKHCDDKITINKKPYKYPDFGYDLGDKELGQDKTVYKKVIRIKKKEEEIPEINIKGPKIEFNVDIPNIEGKPDFIIKAPGLDLFNEKEISGEKPKEAKETLELMLSQDIKEPIYIKKKDIKVSS